MVNTAGEMTRFSARHALRIATSRSDPGAEIFTGKMDVSGVVGSCTGQPPAQIELVARYGSLHPGMVLETNAPFEIARFPVVGSWTGRPPLRSIFTMPRYREIATDCRSLHPDLIR